MKFVFYTNSISPHQLPLARELVAKLVGDQYCYIYTTPQTDERKKMGWGEIREAWILSEFEDKENARKLLMTADVVLSGIRDIELFRKRLDNGLKTIYCSERWFKPKLGVFRLFSPSYFKMALKLVRLLRNSQNLYYYPMGIHAARDMSRLCGLMHGDWMCLFRVPKLDFERKPGGKIWLKGCNESQDSRKYCLDKMLMWGYYVEPSKFDALLVKEAVKSKWREVKVLWVGRLLNLKRVDTIVRAVGEYMNLKSVDKSLPEIMLDIYGVGPEEKRLKKMAAKYGGAITFHPSVSIGEVRKLMRAHDVYVLSSNAYEGWGAVVSEALEEGMRVVGTYEAGASATMLPESNLFHSGDWRRLASILANDIKKIDIGMWTAKSAARALMAFCQCVQRNDKQ